MNIDIVKRRLTIMIMVSMVTISGCENTAPRVETIDEMDQILADGANHIPAQVPAESEQMTPEEVSKALMPTMNMAPPLAGAGQEMKADKQRFDISVSNVPADQFYMSLVEGTNYNIVVHPDLGGTISLNLKKVTILEVMDAVRDVYGYEFERTDYGLRVLPNALESRIFQVDYLNVERSGVSSTSVSSGTLQNSSGSSGNSSDSSSGSGGSSGSGSTGTQVTTLQPLTSFWQELDLSIQSIIGSGDGRSVIISPQSGLVVVRAIPNELRDVEKYLKAAQLISQRQVILEAKILEVELKDSFRSGVNWTALAGSFTGGLTGGGTSLENDSGFSDARGFVPPPGTNLGEVIPASSFGGIFSLAVNSSKFAAFIELLETQGSVQVLSSPRISTMNNQKAVIKVGQDEFFVTNVSSDSSTGGAGTNQTSEIELTPFFSGIALDVTPQISEDNSVTLHVHPSVSRVKEQQKLLTVNGQLQDLPLARSTIRESDSIIRAQSGQIVVIGGLMQDSIDDRDAKTPGAGDVPLFGNLFKQKARAKTKSELIILLRPVVVDSPRRWADAINDSRNSIGEMREEVMNWRDTETIP